MYYKDSSLGNSNSSREIDLMDMEDLIPCRLKSDKENMNNPKERTYTFRPYTTTQFDRHSESDSDLDAFIPIQLGTTHENNQNENSFDEKRGNIYELRKLSTNYRNSSVDLLSPPKFVPVNDSLDLIAEKLGSSEGTKTYIRQKLNEMCENKTNTKKGKLIRQITFPEYNSIINRRYKNEKCNLVTQKDEIQSPSTNPTPDNEFCDYCKISSKSTPEKYHKFDSWDNRNIIEEDDSAISSEEPGVNKENIENVKSTKKNDTWEKEESVSYPTALKFLSCYEQKENYGKRKVKSFDIESDPAILLYQEELQWDPLSSSSKKDMYNIIGQEPNHNASFGTKIFPNTKKATRYADAMKMKFEKDGKKIQYNKQSTPLQDGNFKKNNNHLCLDNAKEEEAMLLSLVKEYIKTHKKKKPDNHLNYLNQERKKNDHLKQHKTNTPTLSSKNIEEPSGKTENETHECQSYCDCCLYDDKARKTVVDEHNLKDHYNHSTRPSSAKSELDCEKSKPKIKFCVDTGYFLKGDDQNQTHRTETTPKESTRDDLSISQEQTNYYSNQRKSTVDAYSTPDKLTENKSVQENNRDARQCEEIATNTGGTDRYNSKYLESEIEISNYTAVIGLVDQKYDKKTKMKDHRKTSGKELNETSLLDNEQDEVDDSSSSHLTLSRTNFNKKPSWKPATLERSVDTGSVSEDGLSLLNFGYYGRSHMLTAFTFLLLGILSVICLKVVHSVCNPSLFLSVTFLSFAVYSFLNVIEACECIRSNLSKFEPHPNAYLLVMSIATPFLTTDAWLRHVSMRYSKLAYAFPCFSALSLWISNDNRLIQPTLVLINAFSLATFAMICCTSQSYIGTAAVIVILGTYAITGDFGQGKCAQLQSFVNFCHCIFLLFVALSITPTKRY